MANPFDQLAAALREAFPNACAINVMIGQTATTPQRAPDALLDLATAAELLGYKPAGLRKIVAATKAGKAGPTIQFSQVGKGPIRFRREWLDDFIAAHVVKRQPKPRPKSKARPPIEPQHGFDNRFFKR